MKFKKFSKITKRKYSYKAAAILIAAVFVSTPVLGNSVLQEPAAFISNAAGPEDGSGGDAPATDAPVVDEPATDAPATDAPVTDAPPTQGTEAPPATEGPSTVKPIDIFGTLPSLDTPTEKGTEAGNDKGPGSEKGTEKTTEKGTEASTDKNGGTTQIQVVTTQVIGGKPQYSEEQISAARAEYQEALERRTKLQTELNAILEKQNDIIFVLKGLDDKIIEYEDKLDDLKKKQDIARDTIRSLEEELEVADIELNQQYDLLKKHIQNAYENGNYSYLDALLNAVDYSDVINKQEYIQQINAYDTAILNDIQERRRSIANRKLMMQSIMDDMDIIQQTYEEEEETLQMLSHVKEKQIEAYQDTIESQSAEVGQMTALEKQLSEKLRQMEVKSHTSISYALFSYTGSKLLWPIPSSTYITSYYGGREAPTEGASTNHRGIDIGGDMGDPLIASADGVIICAEHTGSGGETVMIDIGSGITLAYCHMSAYNCTYGQFVKAGDVVGYVGETGVATGPHLHFGVRVNGEYTDPAPFLGLTY